MATSVTPANTVARVAVLAYTEYPWDARVRREAEAFVEDGYAVHVIALRPKAGPSSGHFGGVHLHEVPLVARRGGRLRYLFQYGAFFLMAGVKLMRIHCVRPLDIVYVHSLPDFLVLVAGPLKFRGIPILLDLHEAMPEILMARLRLRPTSLLVRAAVVLERLSGWFADHVVVANDGIRSVVVARGLPTSKITTVYNSMEICDKPPDTDELRRRFRLPAGRLLVHAGGINPERDLETLIRALALLPIDLDVTLVIAGDGEAAFLERLLRLADMMKVADRIRLVGKLSLEEARALMSLSSVGLVTLEANPLTEIAWPSRIVEFANLGKPLLVPRLRFVHELLGDSARYYVPGDPNSLAVELRKSLGHAEADADTIATTQRKFRDLAWSQVRSQLLSLVRSLGARHVK